MLYFGIRPPSKDQLKWEISTAGADKQSIAEIKWKEEDSRGEEDVIRGRVRC